MTLKYIMIPNYRGKAIIFQNHKRIKRNVSIIPAEREYEIL